MESMSLEETKLLDTLSDSDLELSETEFDPAGRKGRSRGRRKKKKKKKPKKKKKKKDDAGDAGDYDDDDDDSESEGLLQGIKRIMRSNESLKF